MVLLLCSCLVIAVGVVNGWWGRRTLSATKLAKLSVPRRLVAQTTGIGWTCLALLVGVTVVVNVIALAKSEERDLLQKELHGKVADIGELQGELNMKVDEVEALQNKIEQRNQIDDWEQGARSEFRDYERGLRQFENEIERAADTGARTGVTERTRGPSAIHHEYADSMFICWARFAPAYATLEARLGNLHPPILLTDDMRAKYREYVSELRRMRDMEGPGPADAQRAIDVVRLLIGQTEGWFESRIDDEVARRRAEVE